jgi:hypothetical protein
MEYENVTQKFKTADNEQLQCARLSWHVRLANYRPQKPRQ